MGGIQARMAEIANLRAEAFRSAAQRQEVVQSGRAFSGAQVTNDQSQQATLSQEATAEAVHDITMEPAPVPAAGVPPGFHYNFLQQVLRQVQARDLLSRGALVLDQEQGGVQTGYAAGVDFDGNPSTVTNTLNQDEVIAQVIASHVQNHVQMARDPEAANAARFQNTEVTLDGTRVESATVAVQDQGVGAGSVQTGRANGGIVNNTLNQHAAASQATHVSMDNTLDLRDNGPEDTLTPRSVTMEVSIANDAVVNSSSVVQKQGLIQIAEGGVDENGNPTENGGAVHNVANQTAEYSETSTVESTTTILA
jgi:hypothetical protein